MERWQPGRPVVDAKPVMVMVMAMAMTDEIEGESGRFEIGGGTLDSYGRETKSRNIWGKRKRFNKT